MGTSCAVAAVLAFVLSGGPSVNGGMSGNPAAPIKCKEEGSLRSIEANVQTSIVFTNKENQPIRVYWLDYDGKRIPYGTLGTGQVFSTQTYLTHPWLIMDAKESCKAIYMPTSKRLEVSVDSAMIRGRGQRAEDVVNSTNPDYVMQRIRELYIEYSSVTIVMMGKCTWARRCVDWEIQASLRYSEQSQTLPNGLLGIKLPTFTNFPERFNNNLTAPGDAKDRNFAGHMKYRNNLDVAAKCN